MLCFFVHLFLELGEWWEADTDGRGFKTRALLIDDWSQIDALESPRSEPL
jgi:hypothetical protein